LAAMGAILECCCGALGRCPDPRPQGSPGATEEFARCCAVRSLRDCCRVICNAHPVSPSHMRRKIPSTAALVAFESAARHQSFTKAAEELALTQSAVCRQIAALEAFLGVELFRRTRRGVRLTEEGLSYG